MIALKLKERKNPLQFTLVDNPTNLQWTAFVTLQLLDVYSTHRGLKYDCVKEVNPIYGTRPSLTQMLVTKTLIISPIAYSFNSHDIDIQNWLYTFIVLQNADTLNDAKAVCRKL